MSLAVTAWPQIAMQIFGTPFPILGEGEGTEKPKPISRYFEKPIPKPIPTFEKPTKKPKTDTDLKNRYRPSSSLYSVSQNSEVGVLLKRLDAVTQDHINSATQ